MKRKKRSCNFGLLLVIVLLLIGAGCATGPYIQGSYMSQPVFFQPSPQDKTVYLQIQNYTRLNLSALPQTESIIAARGYTRVNTPSQADITINVSYSNYRQNDPNKQAQNTAAGSILGAMMGAALGAAITGGDLDAVGWGALAGAGAGAAAGAATPATTPLLDINVNISNRYGANGRGRKIVNIGNVNSYQAMVYLIDNETANIIVQALPPRN